MHFSWEQHLELSRNVSAAADTDQGCALALMGIGLTLLAQDLLWLEQHQHPIRGISHDAGQRVV
jgi:hypothetical protein